MKCNKISYETLFWVLFVVTTAIAVIDRFTSNVWVRQSFATPGHGTGTDRIPLKQGPWSVVMYDIIARVSGRYTMFALNALFFTMMHTSYHYISTSWLRKYVDFSDDSARLRIHRYIGISICVLTIVHVLSILFPVVFSGYDVTVNPGYFSWPLSEQTPKGFKDADAAAKMMMMQIDDVYRLILMTIMLGPLMYYCACILVTNFRFGIRLHQFIAVMYFIDIARRHTHPHSWVLNTPVFLFWIADKLVGKYLLHNRVKVQVQELNEDYVLLSWKDSRAQNGEDRIANIYQLKSRELSKLNKKLERSHPFTTFKNRDGVLNAAISKALRVETPSHGLPLTAQEDYEANWDVGVLCKIYRKKRSHTKNFRTDHEVDIWGPYHESNLVERIGNHENLLLVGGGSGVAYIVDTLSYIASRPTTLDSTQRINFIFTTKDAALVGWFMSVLQSLVSRGTFSNGNIKASLYVTRSGGNIDILETFGNEKSFDWGTITMGRCKFEEVLKEVPDAVHAFCQGSPGLQDAVQKAVRKSGKKIKYHKSAAFGADAPKKAKNFATKDTKVVV